MTTKSSTKDYKTGVIRQFTQEPGATLGRLEVIKGDPFLDNDVNAGYKFEFNGEIDRAPTSVSTNVSLPADMASIVGDTRALFAANGHINQYPEEQLLPPLLKAAREVPNPKLDMRKASPVRRDRAAP